MNCVLLRVLSVVGCLSQKLLQRIGTPLALLLYVVPLYILVTGVHPPTDGLDFFSHTDDWIVSPPHGGLESNHIHDDWAIGGQ